MGFRKSNNAVKGENTIIGSGTVIGGSIVSDSALMRVDGEVKGGIDTKGDLIIGTGGIVRGDVVAANLNLGGEVTGNATITEKIDIEATGKLIGDITTNLLSIDEKAVIQGKVTMRKAESEESSDDKEAASDDKQTVEESPAESCEEIKEEDKKED